MESLAEEGGALPTSERPSGWERPFFIGKHKLAASISGLQSQITLIQEELEKLETIGESSLVCKEILMSVESVPDQLIPETKGGGRPVGTGGSGATTILAVTRVGSNFGR